MQLIHLLVSSRSSTKRKASGMIPHFGVVVTTSHVDPNYHLFVPAKVQNELPRATVPVVVTYRGKNWTTFYQGENCNKGFDISTWKHFVIDNSLKIGDTLVFELMESSNKELKFGVQILRSHVPPPPTDDLLAHKVIKTEVEDNYRMDAVANLHENEVLLVINHSHVPKTREPMSPAATAMETTTIMKNEVVLLTPKAEPTSPTADMDQTPPPPPPPPPPPAVETVHENIQGQEEEDIDDAEFWPLSGKPFFNVVVGKSHIIRSCTLFIPTKVLHLLPNASGPAIIRSGGKNWNVMYSGESKTKWFSGGWKDFFVENQLKIGDALVFEVMDSRMENLKFRVQILRCDFPAELQDKVRGSTVETAIQID